MARARKLIRRARRTVGSEIIEGLRNAIAFAKGDTRGSRIHRVRVPESVDVSSVRQSLGMSQDEFAARFGISPATLRNWEQGRRQPEGPAKVLLNIIAREPAAVQRALR